MRNAKTHNRAFFLALQADAKGFPGGINALAQIIGCNGKTLANCLNPDHEAPPPSMNVFLELMALAQARRALSPLCQMVGMVPVEMEVSPRTTKEAMRLFMELIADISRVTGAGSEAARDGIFDPQERVALEPLLMELIKAAFEFQTAIRG